MNHPFLRRASVVFLALLTAACTSPPTERTAAARDTSFTIAVLPDTQGYLDYTHQKAAGFPFDAREILFAQMRWVADHVESAGGDIAFVTQLGDVWQHYTRAIDPAHEARGMRRVANPEFDPYLLPAPETRAVEMPAARRAFEILAGKVAFSVLPGNHDADAMWTDARFPPAATIDPQDHSTWGSFHAGGWEGFREVFGSDSPFFRDQPWYVDAHEGGTDSAQVFAAGGHRFLHIALRFDPPDSSLAWAASVIARHPGLPTIVATHHFLDGAAARNAQTDSHALDPEDNNPEMVWQKLISQHDQIFLVLCGHVPGQSRRTDRNRFGHEVHQVLSDYQARGQTALEAGADAPIGDGWMRLMRFDLAAEPPRIEVKTRSTHYGKLSSELPEYALWYRELEQPRMTAAEFLAADEFVIELKDFRARFERP
jgi:hypothetical protein